MHRYLEIEDADRPVVLLLAETPDAVCEASQMLSGSGFVCHVCCQPDDAAALARQINPAVIVCDLPTPDASGVQLCGEVKQALGVPELPIMFLVASQAPDIVRRPHFASAAYYLRKPLDSQVMLELLDQAIWSSSTGYVSLS